MNGINDCLDNSDEESPNISEYIKIKKNIKNYLSNNSISVDKNTRNLSMENWEPNLNGTYFLKFLSELSHQKFDIISR